VSTLFQPNTYRIVLKKMSVWIRSEKNYLINTPWHRGIRNHRLDLSGLIHSAACTIFYVSTSNKLSTCDMCFSSSHMPGLEQGGCAASDKINESVPNTDRFYGPTVRDPEVLVSGTDRMAVSLIFSSWLHRSVF